MADCRASRSGTAAIRSGRCRMKPVTRLTNGKMAIYDTDHFATWLTDFADALEAGEFDD
jgi:hypothetical protein